MNLVIFSLDPQERRCIPHVFHSATSAMYHTYFGHGFFFITRPRPCTLPTIFGCRSSHSMHSRHTSFSSFICNFPFGQKEKFSGMITMDEWIDLVILGIRVGIMFQACFAC